MYKNIAIGADVELFLQHRTTKEVISAEGFVKGTKDDPFIFDPTNKFFATSLDNVLAEFSIPPATNKVEFYNYLRKSVAYINKTIPKEYCTAVIQACSLDSKWLQTEQARLFGCEPDFNAYTRGINQKPYCADANLRSAGGHVHISYNNPVPFLAGKPEMYIADDQRVQLIRALDIFLGLPSLLLEPDNKRKELYGKAGAFRPKPYGLEYRTLSNFYLGSRKLTMWVYDSVMDAITWLNAGNVIDDTMGRFVETTINNNDKHTATTLIKELNLKAA